MSADALCVNSPPVLRASRRHNSNKASHQVPRLDKQRVQQNDRNTNRSKNAQVSVNVPKTQVLPNGAKPDFGNSNTSRRVKNSSQKKGGIKEQKDLTRGLRSLCLPDEKMAKSSRKQEEKKKENEMRQEMESNANSDPALSPNPISPKPPVDPTSPLEKPMMLKPTVTPVVATGAPLPVPPPPSTGILNFMSNSIPTSTAPPSAGLQGLPMQTPCFGGLGYPYGNYAAGPMSYANPHVLPPIVGQQMYPQRTVPMMQVQVPQTKLPDRNYQTPITPKFAATSSDLSPSHSGSKKPTSFAGASFASKDPVINKLPKPSFA